VNGCCGDGRYRQIGRLPGVEFGHPPIVRRARIESSEDARAVEVIGRDEQTRAPGDCNTAHGCSLLHCIRPRRIETVWFEHDAEEGVESWITGRRSVAGVSFGSRLGRRPVPCEIHAYEEIVIWAIWEIKEIWGK